MKNEPETQFSPLESCLIILNYTANHIRNVIEVHDDGFEEMIKIIKVTQSKYFIHECTMSEL